MTPYTQCPKCFSYKSLYPDDDEKPECWHCRDCGFECVDRKLVKGKWRLS